MGTKFLLTFATAICLSGCATVDLADVAASNSAFSRPSIEKNVVERAAGRLYALFTNKGWSAKKSSNRVKLTANVLLNGLEKQDISSPLAENAYVRSVTSLANIQSDIALAKAQVEQTTKAAEIYLAVAPEDRALNPELVSLERALIAGRDAETIFRSACLKFGETAMLTDLVVFENSVDALSEVTNKFGIRVRNITPQTSTSAKNTS